MSLESKGQRTTMYEGTYSRKVQTSHTHFGKVSQVMHPHPIIHNPQQTPWSMVVLLLMAERDQRQRQDEEGHRHTPQKRGASHASEGSASNKHKRML